MTGIDTARANAAVAATFRAPHRPVAVDVGVDDRGNARVFERPGQVGRIDLRFVDPATRRDFAGTRVDANGDTTGKSLGGLAHQIRVFNRGSAENDARDTFVDPSLRWSAYRGFRRQVARVW